MWSTCSEFGDRVFEAQQNSYFCFATGWISEELCLNSPPHFLKHPGFVCVCVCVCIEVVGQELLCTFEDA